MCYCKPCRPWLSHQCRLKYAAAAVFAKITFIKPAHHKTMVLFSHTLKTYMCKLTVVNPSVIQVVGTAWQNIHGSGGGCQNNPT